jgi:hypothetical protein
MNLSNNYCADLKLQAIIMKLKQSHGELTGNPRATLARIIPIDVDFKTRVYVRGFHPPHEIFALLQPDPIVKKSSKDLWSVSLCFYIVKLCLSKKVKVLTLKNSIPIVFHADHLPAPISCHFEPFI